MKYTYFVGEGLGEPFKCKDDLNLGIFCFFEAVPPQSSFPKLDSTIKLYKLEEEWIEYEPSADWFRQDWVPHLLEKRKIKDEDNG